MFILADFAITKNPDGSYKVAINKVVPANEEFAFGTLDEAVNKVKEVEAAEQPQA